MTLKELRIAKNLTQVECAAILGISTRTYSRYENNINKKDNFRYRYIYDRLFQYKEIDEDHGILTIDKIKEISKKIFLKYDVEYCYLFGSYAKGTAHETSDIDLFIGMPIDGLKFFELIEELREKLGKRIDLLDESQITNNSKLALEIFRDGVKIYDKRKG